MKKLVARNYSEAYAFRAKYFADPVMMTGRDATSTRYKMENIVSALHLSSELRVLDVGPGDGTLSGQTPRRFCLPTPP